MLYHNSRLSTWCVLFNRLNESVDQGMAGGTRAPLGAPEGMSITRTVGNELDSAKLDPLLVKAVAKNVSVALEGFFGRMDAFVVVMLPCLTRISYIEHVASIDCTGTHSNINARPDGLITTGAKRPVGDCIA